MRMLARLLLVLLCASGPPRCVETETYLGDPAATEADERMIGEWFGGGDLLISIRRAAGDPAGVLRLTFVMIGSDKEPVSFATFRAWRTVVDGRDYLNLEKLGEHWKIDPPVPARMIVRFEAVAEASVRMRMDGKETAAEGGAQYWLMNAKTVAAAIRAGELQGRVEGEGADLKVTITATRAALRALIAAKGPEHVFQDTPMKLLRLPSGK